MKVKPHIPPSPPPGPAVNPVTSAAQVNPVANPSTIARQKKILENVEGQLNNISRAVDKCKLDKDPDTGAIKRPEGQSDVTR